MTPELELLKPALEMALIVARSGESAPIRVEAPRPLRPFLRFSKPVPRSLAAARVALDDDEFRERVKAKCDEEEVGPGGWLFLARPQGWEHDFSTLVEERIAAREASGHRSAARDLVDAQSRIDSLVDTVARLEAELVRSSAQVQAASLSRAEAEAEAMAAIASAETAANERARAVRELKDMERLLARRTEELRTAKAAAVGSDGVASGIPGDSASPDLMPAEVATSRVLDRDALLAATEDIRRASDRLADLLDLNVDTSREGTADAVADPSSMPPNVRQRPGTVRRSPLRFGQGMVDGTVDAARWLLSRPGALVLVDGYNVSMLAWPELAVADQRAALERAAGQLQVRYGINVVIVFDGEANERSVGWSPVAPSVSVVFSDVDTEADDELLAQVERTSPVTQPVLVVVSNDRRVIDGARSRGANIIRSTEFILVLR